MSIGTKIKVIPSTKAIFALSFSVRPACLTKYQAMIPTKGRISAAVTGQGRKRSTIHPGERAPEIRKNPPMKPSPSRRKLRSRRSGRSLFAWSKDLGTRYAATKNADA
jgi:hypothetical protein